MELVKTEKKTYWASMKCDVIFNDWFLSWTVCSGLHFCKHLYFPHNRQAEVVTNTKLWHNGGILTEQD